MKDDITSTQAAAFFGFVIAGAVGFFKLSTAAGFIFIAAIFGLIFIAHSMPQK